MYESRIGSARSGKPHPDRQRPRLLIIDDSVVVRSAIARIVDNAGQMEVAATLPHVDAALDYLADNRVDVILLDHEMPGVKGLDALPLFLERGKGARVAMLSGHCMEGSESAVRALAMGASEIIEKPSIRHYDEGFATVLAKRLVRLSGPAAIRRRRIHGGVPLRPVPGGIRPGCIAVGASTGGIHALSQLFAQAPRSLGVPILITQHLPASFVPYFVQQLGRMTDFPVMQAQAGDTVLPDHVYIAPGESNLLVERQSRGRVTIALSAERASRLDPLPAVDPMFASIAQCYGAGATGIILTGMGRDGTQGARRIVEAGGVILTQDEESSVVWGMPGYAAQQGLASALLPPGEMFGHILDMWRAVI